jgi:predicted nucleic acid-binding protein
VARPARLTTVVADSGAVYALIDASDAWHDRIVAWWAESARAVVLPVTILPEVAYLLQRRIGVRAEEAFIRAIVDGEFALEPLEAEDVSRALALMRAYADLPLGFVDATVTAVAERLDTREVLTTDRRHFTAVKPRHSRTLDLVP